MKFYTPVFMFLSLAVFASENTANLNVKQSDSDELKESNDILSQLEDGNKQIEKDRQENETKIIDLKNSMCQIDTHKFGDSKFTNIRLLQESRMQLLKAELAMCESYCKILDCEFTFNDSFIKLVHETLGLKDNTASKTQFKSEVVHGEAPLGIRAVFYEKYEAHKQKNQEYYEKYTDAIEDYEDEDEKYEAEYEKYGAEYEKYEAQLKNLRDFEDF